jgi:hypothetical protein
MHVTTGQTLQRLTSLTDFERRRMRVLVARLQRRTGSNRLHE